MAEDVGLDLRELSERAGVTVRTVRYYVQQGLLPSPVAAGPATRYGHGHLDRLRLIRKWQDEYLPLAVIRQRISDLSDEEVAGAVAEREAGTGGAPSDAGKAVLEYIRSLKGRGDREAPPPTVASAPAAAAANPPAVSLKRSTWEVVELAPDVQLQVRRPLTREANRRVERLIEAARKILGEG